DPATTPSKVQQDINWANTFYAKWGGSVTLVEISYINRTSWLAASTSEMNQCHNQYKDTSGPINVYYVNSFTNLEGAAAYAIMECRYFYQTHLLTYIVMSDAATNRVLAHELGHAIGILHDTYLLDYYTCAQLNAAYCPYPPNGSYCNVADRKMGNLMYWGYAHLTQPHHYTLSDTNYENPVKPIDSQFENITYFHKNYPNNFPN
ncbi:MAG TPA: hypothetical protein ENN67_02285, partial [Firmicutes bacterium]|nr:hypothetical protein [Bacillota bacterium]